MCLMVDMICGLVNNFKMFFICWEPFTLSLSYEINIIIKSEVRVALNCICTDFLSLSFPTVNYAISVWYFVGAISYVW